jgi:hypothetical protein
MPHALLAPEANIRILAWPQVVRHASLADSAMLKLLHRSANVLGVPSESGWKAMEMALALHVPQGSGAVWSMRQVPQIALLVQ